MTAQFIISFDCEGKWGMADQISSYHQPFFTTTNFKRTYRKLLSVLGKYNIKATFAFVGAFSLSMDVYQMYRPELKEVFINGRPWLDIFKREMHTGQKEGWFAPECYEMVKEAHEHEIASHGFTHLPLDEKSISLENFQHEMYLLKKYAPYKDHDQLSFIYPRNKIGYTQELTKYGFIGYRDVLQTSWQGFARPIASIAREFNIFERSDAIGPMACPVIIPPGRFLNWRHGFRKRIPFTVTLKRWEYMLQDAIKNDGVVHLWTHPHNFIDGDRMFALLEKILEHVANAQESGKIKSLTQRDFCLRLLGRYTN